MSRATIVWTTDRLGRHVGRFADPTENVHGITWAAKDGQHWQVFAREPSTGVLADVERQLPWRNAEGQERDGFGCANTAEQAMVACAEAMKGAMPVHEAVRRKMGGVE